MAQNEAKKTDNFEQIEDALSRSEQFIEKNQKMLSYSIIGILIVAVIVLAYQKYVKEPQREEAVDQMFMAQKYFERDSFKLALNGDGNALGFLEIAERYGSTPSGNLSNYYIGLCYLYTGEYENAVKYLQKFSSRDFLIANMAIANIGDAYMQSGKFKEAAQAYIKAASAKTNNFSTPNFLFKAGFAYEKNGDKDAALKAYERIEKEFPNSIEARDIEKYITRAKFGK